MALTTKDQTAKFFPLLCNKFNITNIKQDILKWDKEWEAAIASSTAADVLKEISYLLDDSSIIYVDMESVRLILRNIQERAARSLRKTLHRGQFNTIWLLLDASEQRRHILQGLEKASEAPGTLWGQGNRALCPDVTVSNFLLEGGKGFIGFLTRFLEVFDSSDPAFLPNSWWEQASNLPNPWWKQTSSNDASRQRSKSTKLVFETATIDRNAFIGLFLLFSSESILHDITHRSMGMKDVLNIVENTGTYFAHSLALAKATLRDKPLVRCENCTKTPEDIGQGVRFMVCSTCKSKLKFEVHYCSQSCQNEDWPVHKKACGKKEVSKGLSGTKDDDLWQFGSGQLGPIADMMRNLPTNQDGTVDIANVGVGPCKGRRSPAAERQADMLEADKEADYFLFTASNVPVRFVIDDPGAKMVFRINRRMIMTQTADSGLEPMAEYMLKHRSGFPGLSRDVILKQLCAEHGNNTTEKVVEWERKSRERGVSIGTVIESLSKDFMKVFGHTFSKWYGFLLICV
ncbi:uncharacterized protein F5147DRAFT_689867 [Suillus discolor]|uniref:MYND-type domain-containing protein n=1 Tax=Suillus discolor TaxID=1912936 RepID=A0A9P7JUR8_9AGAM|nr:uncharacterized protein F5147DRAFT_689867 [Suillus discolor]KAG2110270.1 hypothetical protein F5147DRAFT_689867 [Suillus discolor]